MNVFGRLGSLGRLIRRIDRRWCAPKFARRLAPRLRRDYGASKFYTAGQIRAACAQMPIAPSPARVGLRCLPAAGRVRECRGRRGARRLRSTEGVGFRFTNHTSCPG